MKKLFLLAVVVFAFAATSFAQKDASTSVQIQLQLPANPNAGASIGWANDMDFAKINYANLAGYVWIKPLQGTTTNLDVIGTPKPATFYIKGLKTGSPILAVLPTGVIPLGNSATFTINNSFDFLDWTADAISGNYTVKLGGRLDLPANFIGTITIPSVTVTLNNP